jgi:hypothetical protein
LHLHGVYPLTYSDRELAKNAARAGYLPILCAEYRRFIITNKKTLQKIPSDQGAHMA